MPTPRLVPTGTWVRLAIVPVVVFVALMIRRGYLFDFWHHLARGEVILESGRLLDHDIFTFTVAGQPLQDVNWLTQILYAWLYHLGGLELVQLLNAIVVALTFELLVLLCWHRGGSLLVAIAVSAFTFIGCWEIVTIRPQTLSQLLFVLVFIVLYASKGDKETGREGDKEKKDRDVSASLSSGRPWLLLVPPLLVGLWTNLHGAFPAGILLIGCFLAAAAWEAWRARELFTSWGVRGLLLSLIASCLATLINPYGWKIYSYVGVTSARAAGRGIEEWLPPWPDKIVGAVWFISLVLLAGVHLIAWTRTGRKPTSLEGTLLLCFLLLSGRSVRMVVWWLFATAPILCELLVARFPDATKEEEANRPSLVAAGMLAIFAGAVLLALPGLSAYNPLLPEAHRTPRLEVDLQAIHQKLLEARPSARRIFTRFEWGEYFGWAGRGHYQVFMDGRIEIYPDDIWDDYLAVTHGRDSWEWILDLYQVDHLILDASYHGESGLVARVQAAPRWQQIGEERRGILLFARR